MSLDIQSASTASRRSVGDLAKTNMSQGVFVFFTGIPVAIYLWFAGVKFGFATGPLLTSLILAAVVCPLVWVLSPTLLPSASDELRHETLKRRTFPFLAFLTLPMFWIEFLFGDPGRARVVGILLLVGTVFCLLVMLISFQRSRALLAWIESRSGFVAFALVVLHAAIFVCAIVLRHKYLGSEHGDDTAYYNQIFWSTLQGEFFRGSVTQERYFNPPVSSEFAIHNSPILLLVLPFYSLCPSFYTLLILRNLLLSASAIPLYLLAKERIGGVAGLIVMVGYFVSANIFYQALNGFYPLQFIALCLPFTFLYFYRERFWPFLVWLLLALAVREEVALTTILFGVYALFLRRGWRWILTPIVVSLAWWWISTEIIMLRSRIAMEELDAFYDAFGGGHNSVLATVLENPGSLLGLFLSQANFAYLYEVVKPTAAIPFLSASSLFMLPTVIVNCVIGSFMGTMRNISYHYSIVASVCVFVALIDGIARMVRYSRFVGVERSVFCLGIVLVLIPGMVLGLADNIRDGGRSGEPLVRNFLPHPHQGALERILAIVPAEASVAAPNILMPHLSYRRKLYSVDRLWRYQEPEIDYIVLDTRLDRMSEKDRNKPKYTAVVKKTRNDTRYNLVFSEDEFEVYQRKTSQAW